MVKCEHAQVKKKTESIQIRVYDSTITCNFSCDALPSLAADNPIIILIMSIIMMTATTDENLKLDRYNRLRCSVITFKS